MMKNLALIVLLFVCVCSCKERQNRNQHALLSDGNNNLFQRCIKNLPTYDNSKSDLMDSYVIENDKGFFLKKEILNNEKCVIDFFNDTNTKHSNDFFYNLKDKKHYPLFKEVLEHNVVIASFVEYYGENDIPGVLLQFNLFDFYGKQIDYLIGFNRFSAEIAIKYEFSIDNSFSTITINKKEEDWLLFDEDGEMIGERKTPLTNVKEELFEITENGYVKK